MLRLAAAVGAMAIHCLAAVDHPDCPPSTCVEYNGFFYRALDGTDPDKTSVGCQTGYLLVPAGWSIVPRDADGQAVAATYVWGTIIIAHTSIQSSTSGSWTAYSSCCAGNPTMWFFDKRGYGYKPRSCDARILIRTSLPPTAAPTAAPTVAPTAAPTVAPTIAPTPSPAPTAAPTAAPTPSPAPTAIPTPELISCPRGEGPTENLTCAPCPEGHMADAGLEPCRPTLTHTLQNLADPRFNIASDGTGIVRIDVEVDLPADGSLYEKASFAYRLDVAPAAGSQSIISECNEQFAFDGASNTFSLVLTYADLSGDCRLNTSFSDTQVIRQGVVAVFLSVTGEGVPGGQGSQWQEPIDVRFPISVHTLGHLTSALTFFESASYEEQKGAAVYWAQEVVYVELSLEDAKIRDELVLEVEDVWLSGSVDPAQPKSHDLLGDVRIYGGSLGVAWRVRFSVEVVLCQDCYLHVRGAVTQAGDSTMDLLSGTQYVLQTAGFDAFPTDPPTPAPTASAGTGSWKPWVIAAIAGAGGALLLLVAALCCCRALRVWSGNGAPAVGGPSSGRASACLYGKPSTLKESGAAWHRV